MFLNDGELPCILIADPERQRRTGILDALVSPQGQVDQWAAYQVCEASDEAECLALAKAHSPDLIVITASFPTSGSLIDAALPFSEPSAPALALCHWLRQHYPFCSILFLLDDPASGTALIDQAFVAGATDTITLPLHAPGLRARVRLLLAEAQSRKQAFRAQLLESIEVATIVTDVKTNVVFWSHGAEQLFGMLASDALNQPLHHIYDVEWANEGSLQQSLDALSTEGEWRSELTLRCHNGRSVFVYVHVQLVEHEGQQLRVAMLHDRSDRHQVEITLREVEQALRQRNHYVLGILQAMPQAVVLLDHAGGIDMWNSAAEALFGPTRASLSEHQGQTAPVHIQECPQFRDLATRIYAGEILRDDEATFVDQDGNAHLLSISTAVYSSQAEQTDSVVAVVSDMTERHRMAIAEREQRILAEALRDVTSALTSTLDLQTVVMRILDNVGRVVQHDSANIVLVEDGTLKVAFQRGYPPDLSARLNELRLDIDEYPYNVMVETGLPRLIRDTLLDAPWQKADRVAWQRSYLGAPIRAYGRIIGFVNLDAATPGVFSLQDAERLQAFADQAAIAIENAELYQAIMRDAEELRVLNRATSFLFTSNLSVTNDLEHVSQNIAHTVTREFMRVDCGIYLVQTEPGDSTPGGLLRLAEDAADSAVFNLPPLTRAELEAWEGGISNEIPIVDPVRRPNVRSWLVLPLRTTQGVIGAMELCSQVNNAFDNHDIKVLTAFAERAAAALENIRLHQELQQRVEQRTAELNHVRGRAEAILHHSSDSILLVGSNHVIQQSNQAFQDTFGYLPAQIDGCTLEAFTDYRSQASLGHALLETFQHGVTSRVEIQALRADGRVFSADVMMSPIFDSHGLVVQSLVCSLRDITERKRMEDDLRTALAKERELNQMRAQFVARASHEFRTPLAVIASASELLQHYGDRLTDEQRLEKFRNMHIEIIGMTHILDELLLISRSDSNTLSDFYPRPLNLAALVEDCIHQIEATDGAAHRIHFSATEGGEALTGDGQMLQRAITNLLMNAVQYSPAGSAITLRLSNTPEAVVLSIQDQGIGIPIDDRTRVFEAFHRGANADHLPGNGLGLVMVKRTVDLHQGTIQVESEEGKGTTFTLEFPHLYPVAATDRLL